MKPIPRATYRLQFNREFTFRQAAEILDYLGELGISDLYASPLFEAGPQSTHGYDTCSFNKINPNLGSTADFERLTSSLKDCGFGLLLDVVPNHMSATLSNPWWLDVLENGRESSYARFFDIDWRPQNPALHDKVLLPVLEDHYDKVLQDGKLRLTFQDGKFFIAYHDRSFPINRATLPPGVIGDPARFLNELNGTPGDARSFDALDALLQGQHYRFAYWKIAAREINYRRFFDVTEMVALKMELPEVFRETHKLIFEWLAAGKVTGLRIDHPDGLWNPKEYLNRLCSRRREDAETHIDSLIQHMPTTSSPSPPRSGGGVVLRAQGETTENSPNAGTTSSSPIGWERAGVRVRVHGEVAPSNELAPPLYVIVEKILSGDEHLPADWAAEGTTGYDFLNRVNGLFVDSSNTPAFDELYCEFTGNQTPFAEIVYHSRKQVLVRSFASELNALTHRLNSIAAATPSGRNLTFSQLHRAIAEIIANFPVYRTYITETSASLSSKDRNVIETAMRNVRERAETEIDTSALDFIERLLLLTLESELDGAGKKSAREFVMKLQQLTGPAMAKGLEDTAFYRFNRFLSLNEVGGEPARFGVSLAEFHEANGVTAKHWPHTMLASATHDTKRGEDVRARLNVLSEMPAEWRDATARWSQWNRDKKTLIDNTPAPDANDEYLLYQTLVGAWPHDADNRDGLKNFRLRIAAFMLKAVKEAKIHTSWTDQNAAYEKALTDFVERVLADRGNDNFLDDLRRFARRVAFFGRINSLAQTLLKIASPGVPDFYQGNELWDLNLVDPDNRRPVNYAIRRNLLSDLKKRFADAQGDRARFFSELLRDEEPGAMKLFLIWRALNFRRTQRELFDCGDYLPLSAHGAKSAHVCGLARRWNERMIIVAVPRLVFGLTQGVEMQPMGGELWQATLLTLPPTGAGHLFRNVFTGEMAAAIESGGKSALKLGQLLKTFPVALLEKV